MIITRDQLRKGMKVKTQWKNKVYFGVILNDPKEDSKKYAQITHGRFIAVEIYDLNQNKVVLMPYTRRAVYELVE